MLKNVVFAATILCFSALASCEKKRQPRYDPCIGQLPPPHRNLDIARFVIRDSTGQNLLTTSSANRLDISLLKISQPCTDILTTAEDPEQNGTVRITIKGSLSCGTLYLKWNDEDIDTLTYLTLASTGECYCTYAVDTAHIMFNDRAVLRDTRILIGTTYTPS